MKSLYDQFADWVKLQPADAEYDYTDNCGCALYLFLHEAGYNPASVAPRFWRAKSAPHEAIRFAPRLEEAVFLEPWTFGALAERLGRPHPLTVEE